MADTNLQATRTSLLKVLGIARNWGDDPDVWMSEVPSDAQRGQMILDNGLAKFYNGIILPGERVLWKWSFLTPRLDFALALNTVSYDMPDDFNGLGANEFAYAGDDNVWCPLALTTIQKILLERQKFSSALGESGPPRMGAFYPVAGDGTEGQRWKFDVYPTPDAAYTVSTSYYSNPYQLTGLKPYPLGGQPHSLTLQYAVLAAGEQLIDQNPMGPNEILFRQAMVSSVNFDRNYIAAQKRLGNNIDPGRLAYPVRRNVNLVTYNGNTYPGV